MRLRVFIAVLVCVGVLGGLPNAEAGWKQGCGRMAYKLGRVAAAIARPVTKRVVPTFHPFMKKRLENYVWFLRQVEADKIPEGTVIKVEHSRYERTQGTDSDSETYFVKEKNRWIKVVLSEDTTQTTQKTLGTPLLHRVSVFNSTDFKKFPADSGEIILGGGDGLEPMLFHDVLQKLKTEHFPSVHYREVSLEMGKAWDQLRQSVMQEKKGVLKFIAPAKLRKSFLTDGVEFERPLGSWVLKLFSPVIGGIGGFGYGLQEYTASRWGGEPASIGVLPAIAIGGGVPLAYTCAVETLCLIHQSFRKRFENPYVDKLLTADPSTLTPKLSGRARDAEAAPVKTKAEESAQPTREVELPDGEERIEAWKNAISAWRGDRITPRLHDGAAIYPLELLTLVEERYEATNIEAWLYNSKALSTLRERQLQFIYNNFKNRDPGLVTDVMRHAYKRVRDGKYKDSSTNLSHWSPTYFSPSEEAMSQFLTALDVYASTKTDGHLLKLENAFQKVTESLSGNRLELEQEMRSIFKTIDETRVGKNLPPATIEASQFTFRQQIRTKEIERLKLRRNALHLLTINSKKVIAKNLNSTDPEVLQYIEKLKQDTERLNDEIELTTEKFSNELHALSRGETVNSTQQVTVADIERLEAIAAGFSEPPPSLTSTSNNELAQPPEVVKPLQVSIPRKSRRARTKPGAEIIVLTEEQQAKVKQIDEALERMGEDFRMVKKVKDAAKRKAASSDPAVRTQAKKLAQEAERRDVELRKAAKQYTNEKKALQRGENPEPTTPNDAADFERLREDLRALEGTPNPEQDSTPSTAEKEAGE